MGLDVEIYINLYIAPSNKFICIFFFFYLILNRSRLLLHKTEHIGLRELSQYFNLSFFAFCFFVFFCFFVLFLFLLFFFF